MPQRSSSLNTNVIHISRINCSTNIIQSNSFHSSNKPKVKKVCRHRSLSHRSVKNQIIHRRINENKESDRSFKSGVPKPFQGETPMTSKFEQNADFNDGIDNNTYQRFQSLNSIALDRNTHSCQRNNQIKENISFHLNRSNRFISLAHSSSAASTTQQTISTDIINHSNRDTSMKPCNEICYYRKKQEERRRRSKRCRCCGFHWLCSPCCILCSIIGIVLLSAAIAAIIVALVMNKSKTTTTLSTAFVNNVTISTDTSTTSVSSYATSNIETATAESSTTTTTARICGASCLNQSWIDVSNTIAKWEFEGSFTDSANNYSTVATSSVPTFISEGYVGQAVSFNATLRQALYTSYIPLRNISFTIDAWIYQNGKPNPTDYNIAGMCPSMTTRNCLQVGIRSQKLYFSFWLPDSTGVTTIQTNQWLHTAFVFDKTSDTMITYLNGFADKILNTNQTLLCSTGNFTIGINALVRTPDNTFQGYIDNLSVSGRAKSSCEVLEIATLAARFHFDNISPLDDFGPNQVDKIASNYIINPGFINEAISFSGTSTSYFQTRGFTSFGIMNKEFSFAFWIKPQLLSGTLIHLSTSSLGTGTTCFPLLAFASNGSIVAQVLLSNGVIISAVGPLLPTSSSWIPIVQTWSSNNGLKLYVNNTLVSSIAATTFFTSNSSINYLTLSNCLTGCGSCTNGLIASPGPFLGSIDEWLVFSRELNEDDVCAHYNTR